MANIPQKTSDATEDALQAIQQAMSPGAAGQSPTALPADDHAQTEPPAVADLFIEPAAPDNWDADANAPRRAANDDRASLGQLLRSVHGRPARMPYIVASLAAVIWTAGVLAVAYVYHDELQTLFATPRVGIVAMIGAVSAIVVPLTFFFVLAHMFRRSHELRLVAETMAEVAMQLTQPETTARDQIVSVGQAIRREVAAMGDGVERALARAAELESLVQNEVSALERAYNDNEVRIRDMLSELTNQREMLVNQAEHVRNAIASVHLDLSHDITSVGDLVSDKVNDVAQRVTRSLTEKGEHITLALGHAGDSMIDALSERSSTLLDRLEATSDRATTAISAASDHLTTSLNFKTDTVHDEFADLGARLQQLMAGQLDQIAETFSQKATVTIDTMASRTQQFNDALTQTGGQLAETITARAEEVNNTLRSTGESLALDLSLRGNDVVSKLEQTGALITDTMINRGDAVTNNFQENAQALTEVIAARGDAVKDMLVERLESFEDMFNQGGTALSEKVSREAGTLGSLITSHMAEFDRTVKTYGGELVERLGQRTHDVSEVMRNYVDTFDQRLTGHAGELTGSVDARLAQFEENLATRVTDLTANLTDGGKQVVDALEGRISSVSGTITTRGTEVADAIAAKIVQIDQTLGTHALEVVNALDSRVNRFEDLLVGRTETAANQLEARAKAAADLVHARLDELGQSIKSNSADAERSLGQIAASTSETLRASAGEVERTLLGVSAEVTHSFVSKAEEIANVVGRRAEEMAAVLSDKSGGVIAAITEKGQQFASDVTKATDEAMKSIEDKGYGFTCAMLDNSAEITRMINSASEAAANSVNHSLAELHESAQKAIDQSKSAAAATVGEMRETHAILSADTATLFERLREANIMLQEVMTGSHNNMSTLENTLVLRVAEFVTAMGEVSTATGSMTTRVETNVAEFRDVTARAVADLGQLASQFADHGRDLAKAAEQIDGSNQRAETSVKERRLTLESLVTTLDSRTDDFDQRLKRFTVLLDESLEAASARARDIARVVSLSTAEGSRAISDRYEEVREGAENLARVVAEASAENARAIGEQYERSREGAEKLGRLVAESSAESARAIGEQYERVRENADEERRRTAEMLHTIYEQSAADTQALFNEASARFAETINGMKQMAVELQRELATTRAEMNRELEATRTELRRGAFELPQETAEGAAQMRRVIVDQIEALAELNRIVARHGRNLDAVEPQRRPAREDSAVTMAAARNEASPPPRGAAPRTDVGSFAPAARRQEAATPGQAPTAATRGWLTELLNRASEGEPTRDLPRESSYGSDERQPRHSIESLDSLSVDIARMIDHDAAVELWDRYKRGERNVFTRRLYTLQGQQAFDEIRKKYRGDREFKQTVDRYVGEFERLLDEVSHDDRGQVVARTYLTSETGKVYTMLAHAAGRFD